MRATCEGARQADTLSGNGNGNPLGWVCYGLGVVTLLIFTYSFLKTTNTVPFGTYWSTGKAARQGLNPYGVYAETFRSNFTAFGGPASFPDVNLNPPCLLPLFQTLSTLPLAQFGVVWTIGSFLLFTFTAALLVWSNPQIQNRQVLWLLLSAPVIGVIHNGQIYGLLYFLAGAAWVLYDRGQELAAAFAIGLLVSFKPTMAFWPAFLFIAGHRKLAGRSLAVIAVLAGYPAVLYGPAIYAEWFAALKHDLHWVAPMNVALIPLFMRLRLPSIGPVTAAVLATALAWRSRNQRGSFDAVSGMAICAGIFCAPLGWYDYVLMAAPFFVARRWGYLSQFGAALLAIPTALAVMAAGSMIYLTALAIVLTQFVGLTLPRAGRSDGFQSFTTLM